MVWRFVGLFRSIDLERTLRIVATEGHRLFVSVRRKGKRNSLFEQVMSLPCKEVSPMHLLTRYVRLTIKKGKPRGPLLVQVYNPYGGLTSNTIAGITRRELARLGVDIEAWGPHTTRGAFVDFYKRLELPSEVVAELGNWANPAAFDKHYLRLKAVDQAASKASNLVHKASLVHCAVGVPWHKASLPPPPPPWRHGTARHKTGRHAEIPTPPPSLTLLHTRHHT